jgi:hypothetical protein
MTQTIPFKVIHVPIAALHAKSTRSAEKFQKFVRLVAASAPEAGVRDAKGVAVRLRKGQLVASHEDLGTLWGESRSSARRTLEGFARDGLVSFELAADVAEILVEEGMDPPAGTLVSVMGYKDSEVRSGD